MTHPTPPTPAAADAAAALSAEASQASTACLPLSDERRYLLGMRAIGASSKFVFSNDPQGSLKEREVAQFSQFVTPEDVLSLIAENAALKKAAEEFGSDFRARRAEWREEQRIASDRLQATADALAQEKQRAGKWCSMTDTTPSATRPYVVAAPAPHRAGLITLRRTFLYIGDGVWGVHGKLERTRTDITHFRELPPPPDELD